MWTGIAVAFAFLEVVAGLYPHRAPPKPEERVVAQVVTISQRTPPPTPPPTPAPTPKPTPRITPTPRPHYTLAPVTVVLAPAAKAAATPALHIGGAAAAKHLAVTRTPQRTLAHAPVHSLANGKAAGQQNGGTGTGGGAGVGTGGLGGTGSGTGKAGNGNAGDVSTAPCGEVILEPSHLGYRRDGTVVQEVIAKVTLRDGSVTIGKFPWPFLYPGEKLNPFTHDELVTDHNGVPVQPPPPGTDIASLPAAVQIVLKHTDLATGYTSLPTC